MLRWYYKFWHLPKYECHMAFIFILSQGLKNVTLAWPRTCYEQWMAFNFWSPCFYLQLWNFRNTLPYQAFHMSVGDPCKLNITHLSRHPSLKEPIVLSSKQRNGDNRGELRALAFSPQSGSPIYQKGSLCENESYSFPTLEHRGLHFLPKYLFCSVWVKVSGMLWMCQKM